MADQIAIRIAETIVNAGSAVAATVNFRTRSTGAASTPSSIRYRVDCLTSQKQLINWTSVSAANEATIEVPGTSNATINRDRDFEERQLTVEIDTGLSTQSRMARTWRARNIRTYDTQLSFDDALQLEPFYAEALIESGLTIEHYQYPVGHRFRYLDTFDVVDAHYYRRTAAEIAAGVTPTNFQYEPGDLRRYGTLGSAAGDTAALQAATLTGYAIRLPEKTTLQVNGVVTVAQLMFGFGNDSGQTTIELLTGGEIVVGDEHAWLSGFRLESSVTGITFLRLPHSYTKLDHITILGTEGEGQTAIEFDATDRDIYQTSLTNAFIQRVDTLFQATGGTVNNNNIGDDSCFFHIFTHALKVDTTTIFTRNTVKGYFESGTNFLTATAGIVRDNVFDVWLDAVSNAVNTLIAFAHNLWPQTHPDQFVTTGVGVVARQTFVKKISFRAYLSTTDQTITDNTATKIEWNAETFDDDSVMVLSPNYRLNVPRAARMHIVAQADISGNLADGDRVQLAIRVNGAEVTVAKEYVSGGTNGARIKVQDVLNLAEGDFVEIYAFADETAAANSHTVAAGALVTYFAGYEL